MRYNIPMYLKSLELSGFKSFAKKATLSFTSAITGIVGPNGSGKSNTAEAFRFVLGEQSIKSLRGKRGEDMIWNNEPRANRAQAKLTFDNSRRIFPTIDFDEVSVERVVHRDNSNEYLLNGSQVRLKDVVEMLASAHIGASGHHIISQGEADRILSASIRERREMIEDALGLKIYQWKKLESIRKLERTDENMKQVESLRREIAPHIRFLKKQVEKLERAEEMRKELIEIYQEYFGIESAYVKHEKERLNRELAGPKKELSELDRELDRVKSILTASKNKDQKSEEVVALEGRLSAIRSEKDAVTREIGRLEGEVNANRRAKEKEEGRMKQEEFKTVYIKDVEEVIHTIETFRSIEDAKKLFSEVVAALKGFIAKHRGSNDSALIAEAEKEIDSLGRERAAQEEKLRALGESEAKLRREYESLKHAIEKEKDTNRDAEKDVFRVIARQNEVRNTIATLTADLNAVARDEEAFKRELGEAAMIAGREATEYQAMTNDQETITKREKQEEMRHRIEKYKIRLEDAGAAGGTEVMKEYRETEERDAFLARELEDLAKAKDELNKLVAELDARIDFEFKNGILKINS